LREGEGAAFFTGEEMTRIEAKQEKMREKVYYRLYKKMDYGRAFPVNCEDNLKRRATPALFERLATCDDKTFEEVAVPLARLEKAEEAV
jgi:hypothetical protein